MSNLEHPQRISKKRPKKTKKTACNTDLVSYDTKRERKTT
jgi:hypothetical protein